MAVSDVNDMGHDVFSPRSDRGGKAYAYHKGSGTKLGLESVPYSQSNSKNSTSGTCSSLSALEQMEEIAKAERPN